jgi:L-seryl-tRNA(Ser) seleniumtransferase
VDERRLLPKVDVLAQSEKLSHLPPSARTHLAREVIASGRQRLENGLPFDLTAAIEEAVSSHTQKPVRVINCSGVILHTGLGRARLHPEAAKAAEAVALDHATIEFNLSNGARGDRQEVLRRKLQVLTGAEDALVVNNAAGAVLLSLAALAPGKEVLLSRGQMVEIGGSFRMPEIVQASGARLREVGCTNRTHLTDYEAAISEITAVILRCHTSNYRVEGFVHQPSRRDLAQLAHAYGLNFVDDMGTGLLANLREKGLRDLVTMRECLEAGADIVIGSGDKLLGGPQAGIILGTRAVVSHIAKHPIARCLRIDKSTLAALNATLQLYVEGREFEIPTLAAIAKPLEKIREVATLLAEVSQGKALETETEIGAGSGPGSKLPSIAVALPGDAQKWSNALRAGDIPVIPRIHEGLCLLDLRTISDDEIDLLVKRLHELI